MTKRNPITRVTVEMADGTRYDFTIARKASDFLLSYDWEEVPSESAYKAFRIKRPGTLTLTAAVKRSVRTAGVAGK